MGFFEIKNDLGLNDSGLTRKLSKGMYQSSLADEVILSFNFGQEQYLFIPKKVRVS